MLSLSGLFLLGGGISNLKTAKREKKRADEQLAAFKAKPAAATKLPVEVLTSWIYSVSDWKEFVKWERKERKQGTIIEVSLVVVLGTLALRGMQGWILALIISSVIAILYGLLKYFLKTSSIRSDEKGMPEVIITNENVYINGRIHPFYADNLWLGKVDIREEGQLNIFEITYCWNTRKGESFEEIRVPIPKGKLKEAISVQEQLMSTKYRR